MRPGGFEPPTNSLEGCCSIHLSYGRRNNLRDFATLNVCRTYGKHLPAGFQGQPFGRVLHHLRPVTHRSRRRAPRNASCDRRRAGSTVEALRSSRSTTPISSWSVILGPRTFVRASSTCSSRARGGRNGWPPTVATRTRSAPACGGSGHRSTCGRTKSVAHGARISSRWSRPGRPDF